MTYKGIGESGSNIDRSGRGRSHSVSNSIASNGSWDRRRDTCGSCSRSRGAIQE